MIQSLLAISTIACGGDLSIEKPHVDAPASPACARGRELRTRAAAYAEAGYLDRANRAIGLANALCGDEATATQGLQVEVLLELGDFAAAAMVADALEARWDRDDAEDRALRAAREALRRESLRIAPDEATKQRMREEFKDARRAFFAGEFETAKREFLEVWEAVRPQGETLLYAALAATNDGKVPADAAARRLFDRALHEIESERRQRVVVDVPNGYSDIGAMAFSPDGRFLAISHANGTAIVDVARARESVRLEGKTNRDAIPAFSEDGRFLALADGVKARIWETATTTAYPPLEHPRPVLALRVQGTDVSTVADDGHIRVWDGKTGALRREVVSAMGNVSHAAFAPGGGTAALVDGADVMLVDAQTGQKVLRLEQGAASVVAVRFGTHTLATSSADGTVTVYGVDDGAVQKTLRTGSGALGGITALGLSPVDRTVAAGSAWGALRAWGLRNNSALSRDAHSSPITSIAFSPDGRLIASGSPDKSVKFWKSDDLSLQHRLEGHTRSEVGAFAPSRPDLLAVTGDHFVRFWTLRDRGDVTTAGDAWFGGTLAFAPDSRQVVVASQSFRETFRGASLVSADTLNTIANLDTEDRLVTALAVSRDGKTAAGGMSNNAVRTWSLESGETLATFTGHRAEVHALAFVGTELVSGGDDGTLRFWPPPADPESAVRYLQSPVRALVATPDDKRFVSSSLKSIAIWDLAADTASVEAPIRASALAISPDGATLVAGADDGAVRTYEVASLRETGERARHPSAVRAVSYSSDGRWIASISDDGVVLSRPDGEATLILRTLQSGDGGYAVTPDGRAVEFLGIEHARARTLASCRVGAATFPFELCAGRVEVDGLLDALARGDDLDATL
ncbi:MAG: hypothetical protein U0271_22295 [Polyangiaceae bacterium]